MTGPSGNRLSICLLRFRIASPKIFAPRSIETLWGGDPESLGANRSAYYPRDQSLFVKYTILATFISLFFKIWYYHAIHCEFSLNKICYKCS